MHVLEILVRFSDWAESRLGSAVCCGALALALGSSAIAEQTAPTQPTAPPDNSSQVPTDPAQQTAPPAATVQQPAANQTVLQSAAASTGAANPAPAAQPAAAQTAAGKGSEPAYSEITEDELKQQLVGKSLFLRGGYLDNSLTFNEHGAIIGHSAQGSFTLSGIEIDKVHLTKHKLELEGARYGLHFLGALAYEDPTTAVDRVRITPKKKVVKITIDREEVLPRKNKNEKQGDRGKKPSGGPRRTAAPSGPPPAAQATPPATALGAADTGQQSDADQAKAEIAAAPAAERPADPASVTATYSQGHANNMLKDALSRVFAAGIDDKLIASMPDCWKLYYQAQAANADYRPADPAVMRQNAVDKKARLLTAFQPESNEYAQANAVSGMALYHTVIGPEGKPVEIAVGRPIGFGLDESAVDAIRKASFEPAIKDGKPVPVLLDLVVQFHIYSKRTAAASPPEDTGKQPKPTLPGPYSVQHPSNLNSQ